METFVPGIIGARLVPGDEQLVALGGQPWQRVGARRGRWPYTFPLLERRLEQYRPSRLFAFLHPHPDLFLSSFRLGSFAEAGNVGKNLPGNRGRTPGGRAWVVGPPSKKVNAPLASRSPSLNVVTKKGFCYGQKTESWFEIWFAEVVRSLVFGAWRSAPDPSALAGAVRPRP